MTRALQARAAGAPVSAIATSRTMTRLTDRYASRCLSVARQVLREEEAAQRAVVEAYLDLWQAANRFDPEPPSVGTWLVVRSHRRAVERIRAHRGGPRPAAAAPALCSDVGLQEEAHRALLGIQTVTLLLQLPEDERRCLMLAYWGGCSTSEIATLVGIPVESVKTRCRSALQHLGRLVAGPVSGPAGRVTSS